MPRHSFALDVILGFVEQGLEFGAAQGFGSLTAFAKLLRDDTQHIPPAKRINHLIRVNVHFLAARIDCLLDFILLKLHGWFVLV